MHSYWQRSQHGNDLAVTYVICHSLQTFLVCFKGIVEIYYQKIQFSNNFSESLQ